MFVWYDRDCDYEDIDHQCDVDVDVDVDENDDDDNDDHGKSDMNTTNIHKSKFRGTVIFMMITICHVDDEGDVDGCRKCNCDSFGGGCCDSDDDVDCKCDGDVDVEGNGDGDVFGCGHGDGYGFMMNEFFYCRDDDIDLFDSDHRNE